MSYLVPSEFVTKMVDAGESKIFMSARDTVIRAYMAGAILFVWMCSGAVGDTGCGLRTRARRPTGCGVQAR